MVASQVTPSLPAHTPATPEEALAVLRTPDSQLLEVVAAAAQLRYAHFGMTVKVNYLVNLKSGICPEDCGYCSQRLGSGAEILKYSWLSPADATRQAEFGVHGGAGRVCLVASGRGPSNRDIDRVGEITRSIKESHPQVEVCACLGILKDNQAAKLKEFGVDAYNHNLNTAESKYEDICTTHTYADRQDTVNRAKVGGLSPCSGLIVGMGETDEQVIEAITALRALDSDSIPINFLIPFDGTPLAGVHTLTPQHCMRILCAVRFMCPDKEIRIAGGREMHLRTLQPLSLHVANSLFLGDYLTSEGQDALYDLDMIVDGGFTILGVDDTRALRDQIAAERAAGSGAGRPSFAEVATPSASPSPSCGSGARVTIPVIRRRGAGTDLPPNA